jgi:hypothetical protein
VERPDVGKQQFLEAVGQAHGRSLRTYRHGSVDPVDFAEERNQIGLDDVEFGQPMLGIIE